VQKKEPVVIKTNEFRVGAIGCTCLFLQNAGRFPVDTKKYTVLVVSDTEWTPSCNVSGNEE